MRKLVYVTAAAAALMVAQAAHAVTWDMSSAFPETNFHVKNAKKFAEEVSRVTDGEVNITVHSGGALGIKGPEALSSVRDGIVPIAEYSFEQQNGEVPFASLGAMPGLAMGFKETRTLVDTIRPAMEEIFQENNQKLLYVVPWPGQGVYADRPIEQVDDLAGYKIRAANARAVEFFEALGAAPVLLPWAEVVPSLATGVVKGVSTSSSSGVDGKFWEFLSDYTRFDWANPLSVVTVNLDSWNALSEEDQAAITELAAKLEPQFWDVAREEDEGNLAKLRENGMDVSDVSPELAGQIAEQSEKIWDQFAEQAGDRAADAISEYREKVGK
ncbi:TRAP transporter substrate-binding protein [Pseudohoeflea coraliihabitans]|uniref:TRAP transporter substrate-binding protein n=1 Tax=Pseudohoeflea coraliihabitans TaxID=2860393 RepID=A0ABS6WMJ7_9HYPH|nr:TRAP transporter substrate-binding protein [Pseudohoeflea sp. DP4N28-3]MBW3097172.1 TRAP transporter substrate-binding protein [Pseudohoeflea sp. DP4N28-3]